MSAQCADQSTRVPEIPGKTWGGTRMVSPTHHSYPASTVRPGRAHDSFARATPGQLASAYAQLFARSEASTHGFSFHLDTFSAEVGPSAGAGGAHRRKGRHERVSGSSQSLNANGSGRMP